MTYLLPLTTTADERDKRVAVLPVGSLEQHGRYLPLITDTVIACTIAERIAAAYPVQLLPPITISCSHEHAAWPGTVSISARTLYDVVRDIADSLARSGVPNLVVVNGHGGNYVLSNVVQESRGRMSLFPAFEDWESVRAAAGMEVSAYDDMHGGELETSILLHAHPELVKPGYEASDHDGGSRRFLLTSGMGPYTESGVIGRASLASARKGEDLLAGLVGAFRDHLVVLDG
ncbi:creatininase family protein [Lentzea tibetensis]|uniref:Creatininase family protein n=1 Tax=Lentzea tibetensis TaxID=2591470 RepID=A0A563EPG2_9PSEU|nr:creatininase family protein [Lentzea tibetensis]TWP49283.1 creatininase family protein [Lentzea tibetensis]